MSANTSVGVLTSKFEDFLPYLIPLFASFAGFNWSALLSNSNPYVVAIAFGFMAKLLYGIQQNGLKNWEDVIPTLIIGLGFLVTMFNSNPNYLAYGTVLGFIVKALATFQANSASGYLEDGILSLGGLLIAYGTYSGNVEIASMGALFSLVGKTVPSFASTPSIPSPIVTPA